MGKLSGKTALVTGASRGIGRAAAVALAHAGARVLVHYGQAEAEAEAVVAEIKSAGGRRQSFSLRLDQGRDRHTRQQLEHQDQCAAGSVGSLAETSLQILTRSIALAWPSALAPALRNLWNFEKRVE